MFKKTLTILILSFLVFSCKTVQLVTNGVASKKQQLIKFLKDIFQILKILEHLIFVRLLVMKIKKIVNP